jgi:hypothetical protein
MLSKFTEATANNSDVQTNEVLNEVAIYFEVLSDFVNESQVIINMTVSSRALNSRILFQRNYKFFNVQIIVDVVRVVNSLLQWAPGNIMVASSSRLVYSTYPVV